VVREAAMLLLDSAESAAEGDVQMVQREFVGFVQEKFAESGSNL
jgi:hypothetical protein